MKYKPFRLVVILIPYLLLVSGFSIAPRPQQPDRLVVDNQLTERATIYGWKYNGSSWDWQFVTQVEPGQWVPIYGVYQNEQYRASTDTWCCLYHEVYLQDDANYGGRQDVWVLLR